MADKDSEQKALATAQRSAARGAAVVVGRLLVGSTPAAPLVDFDGNAAGPLCARTTIALDAVAVSDAVGTGCGAVLVFENGDPRLPILTGLLQREQKSLLEELLLLPRPAAPTGKATREAQLDGDRVVLEGKREVVLKCGDASITLRSDGKVVVRGLYVETHARGVNRIKGGSVKIN